MSEVSVRIADGDVVAVSGVMKFDTVSELWRACARHLRGRQRVVFDLGEVTGSDSAGLALLIEWMRESRHRGIEVHFRRVPPKMMAMARASGLDHLLP